MHGRARERRPAISSLVRGASRPADAEERDTRPSFVKLRVSTSSARDPSWAATREDLRRLAWVLGLLWLALAAFTTLAQRYLGWRLAVGLIGGAGALFTLGLVLVAAGSIAAASLERRWAGRQERSARSRTDKSTDPPAKP
jgi:hypothetical protein